MPQLTALKSTPGDMTCFVPALRDSSFEAFQAATARGDVRPNSAAERSKLRKAEEERRKAPPPPPQEAKTKRQKLRPAVKREKELEEKAMDLKHAFGLCCEAQVKLEETCFGSYRCLQSFFVYHEWI